MTEETPSIPRGHRRQAQHVLEHLLSESEWLTLYQRIETRYLEHLRTTGVADDAGVEDDIARAQAWLDREDDEYDRRTSSEAPR